MPLPIALDVLFAAQLEAARSAPGHVMMWLLTLGFSAAIGCGLALEFQMG